MTENLVKVTLTYTELPYYFFNPIFSLSCCISMLFVQVIRASEHGSDTSHLHCIFSVIMTKMAELSQLRFSSGGRLDANLLMCNEHSYQGRDVQEVKAMCYFNTWECKSDSLSSIHLNSFPNETPAALYEGYIMVLRIISRTAYSLIRFAFIEWPSLPT